MNAKSNIVGRMDVELLESSETRDVEFQDLVVVVTIRRNHYQMDLYGSFSKYSSSSRVYRLPAWSASGLRVWRLWWGHDTKYMMFARMKSLKGRKTLIELWRGGPLGLSLFNKVLKERE